MSPLHYYIFLYSVFCITLSLFSLTIVSCRIGWSCLTIFSCFIIVFSSTLSFIITILPNHLLLPCHAELNCLTILPCLALHVEWQKKTICFCLIIVSASIVSFLITILPNHYVPPYKWQLPYYCLHPCMTGICFYQLVLLISLRQNYRLKNLFFRLTTETSYYRQIYHNKEICLISVSIQTANYTVTERHFFI